MTCESPCDNCNRQGLPILFTRYAAAYSARTRGMEALSTVRPAGELQEKPGHVALATALYNVRMLRPGCLYLLIDIAGEKRWEGYAVHPHGYLTAFPVEVPESAKAHAACARDARQANASMVWVQDAVGVENLWYMFHPDPIDPEHLKKVIQAHPSQYMQSFNVAGWVNGSNNQKDTCKPAQLNSQVMEFAALAREDLQAVGNEQHFGLMGSTPQERGWGSYREQRNGRHFGETAGGAATGPAVGPYVVTVENPPYAEKHGPRLEGMRKFLLEHKGAVIACEDAIGIAQELSLHHLTAAIPYMDWLRVTDDKGVSNRWKQAASESIRTIRSALAKKTVEAYDDDTERLRNTQEAMSSAYPGAYGTQSVKLRRPDGSYEEVSVQELNRRRQDELQARIRSRESEWEKAREAASQKALVRTDAFCDMVTLEGFDKLHVTELENRDQLMDKIAADLQGWLAADALIEKALGRYSEKPGAENSDGVRCAGQLCAILLQIDSAPKGRQWYGSLDLFTPHKRNLVWRMLSLNNAAISAELQAALAPLTGALPPVGAEAQSAEENARSQKAYASALAALGGMSKTLAAADKLNSELATLGDSGAKAAQRLQAALQVGTVMMDSPHAVLATAVVARFKALPVIEAEKLIAKAQVLLLAQGLGKQAVAFAKKQEAAALTGRAAKQARYTQRGIEKALKGQISEVSGQGMRLPTVLLTLNALAILPAMARARTRGDARTTSELLGTLAGLMGSMRQWRADLYESAIYKRVPDLVHKTHRASVLAATEAELLSMKSGAAKFVVAGAVVGVVWDAVDGDTARTERETALAWAYFGRSVVGGVAIGTTLVGARYLAPPLWLVRTNLITLIASGALTYAIGRLKGDAWVNWLRAQPFRISKIPSTGEKQAPLENKKTPFKSEEEMMQKLADALAEMD